jgi:hypothetical protein
LEHSHFTRRAFAAALASTAGTNLLAQTDKPAKPLFNGKDLSGWTIREGPQSAFYVADGAIASSPSSSYPAWLSTEAEYENFDLQCEFYFKGWVDGGIYIHAPEHGQPSRCGLKVNIFHQKDEKPEPNSMGAIFPLVAPLKADQHRAGEWNQLRILTDWPQLRVWVNGELVQDLKLDTHPELSKRLRRGYIGIVGLTYPLRIRNIKISELPSKISWITLWDSAADMDKWFVSESNERTPVRFEPYGHVLRGDGLGHIATKELYRDLELQLYIRAAREHNGGVLFRSEGKGLKSPRHYEIQLHDVPEAHFPTGSLYYHKRSKYPDIQPEKWFLFQLMAKGKECWVRINGETVLEYDSLKDTDPGHIELQAHQAGRWLEFKKVQIRSL